MQIKDDFVAQLVEQLTLNQWAVGSSPTEVTEMKPLTFVSGFLFVPIFLALRDGVKCYPSHPFSAFNVFFF